MLIAVCSDAHDNIWNVEKMLPGLREAEVMLFCGDFCAPFTLAMLAEGFSGPIHAVLGNNDGDALLLHHIASQHAHVTLHQGMAALALGGSRIAVAHYPQIGEALARSGQYDAVFSGHTHRRHAEMLADTLWANPGEVMGRYGEPSYGMYDTVADSWRMVEIAQGTQSGGLGYREKSWDERDA